MSVLWLSTVLSEVGLCHRVISQYKYLTLMFVVGELLSKTARTFDPLNVLLRRDIWITQQKVGVQMMRILNVRLKSSKESQASTRGIVVEVLTEHLRVGHTGRSLKL